MGKLSKVVIPVAGLGTRMLPSTKVIPKEMLPIVDKPIIQYVVEEVIEAGFNEVIFITHSSKNSIENHFDKNFELETELEKRVKRALLKEIKDISKLNVNITSVRQGQAKGLGHAILKSKPLIGDEPFAVVLPDRVMDPNFCDNKNYNLGLMRKEFLKIDKNMILVEKVAKKDVSNYGIVSLKKMNSKSQFKILDSIVEKPSRNRAPSNLAVVGRYIFTPEIFNFIDINKNKNEIELTSAISLMSSNENEVICSFLEGECFDCGNHVGYLRSILKTAKYHPKTKKYFKKTLTDLL